MVEFKIHAWRGRRLTYGVVERNSVGVFEVVGLGGREN